MKGLVGFIRGGHEAVTEKPSAIIPVRAAVETYGIVNNGSVGKRKGNVSGLKIVSQSK